MNQASRKRPRTKHEYTLPCTMFMVGELRGILTAHLPERQRRSEFRPPPLGLAANDYVDGGQPQQIGWACLCVAVKSEPFPSANPTIAKRDAIRRTRPKRSTAARRPRLTMRSCNMTVVESMSSIPGFSECISNELRRRRALCSQRVVYEVW